VALVHTSALKVDELPCPAEPMYVCHTGQIVTIHLTFHLLLSFRMRKFTVNSLILS
jgi:hypothetical protein